MANLNLIKLSFVIKIFYREYLLKRQTKLVKDKGEPIS